MSYLTCSTSPKGSNNSLKSSSVIVKAKFLMKSLDESKIKAIACSLALSSESSKSSGAPSFGDP